MECLFFSFYGQPACLSTVYVLSKVHVFLVELSKAYVIIKAGTIGPGQWYRSCVVDQPLIYTFLLTPF